MTDYTQNFGSGRPRVIRKVTKKDRKGNPKIAGDRKTKIKIEIISGKVGHVCGRKNCKELIQAGTPYFLYMDKTTVKRMGHRTIPDPIKYHPICLPEAAKPLLRFFMKREDMQ